MENNQSKKPSRAVLVKMKQGQAWESMMRFTDNFLIGRHQDNDLQIQNPCVSRHHVKIEYDGEKWWIRDQGSANGTYLGGNRVQEIPLPEEAEIQLGEGGPVLLLSLEKKEAGEEAEADKVTSSTERFASVTQILQRYFTKSKDGEVGLQTLMLRRAFDRIHKKRSRKFLVIIGVCLLLLLTAGSVILYQKSKFEKLRNTAVDIFYNMKSLEIQIAQLEEIVLMKADKYQIQQIHAKREQMKEMEKNYDHFLKELGIYKKMRDEDQIIYRIARIFGECDANVPSGFTKEVWKYIEKWKASDRLEKAISRSRSEGYAPAILKVMGDFNLPPHFFYIALKESEFNARAVGPKTKYGYAKGMWQFIPLTAKHYGLQIGPLYQKGVYDPQDERFHFEKATEAAAKYIKNLKNNLAQASGLLVMTSYNWSEVKVREILRGMPESPRQRNFWLLLTKQDIPKETYDYVFYIFSAAVICENPRLFGFSFDGPFS